MTSGKAPLLKPFAAWMVTAIAAVLVIGLIAAQPAFAEDESPSCSVATLRGTYIFDASGYINLPSGWTPKAVVEFLQFNGDGTLTSVGTANIGGNLAGASFHPTTGNYTVNEDCTGTLAFNPSGPHFDIFVVRGGSQLHMIQTDTGNVLVGRGEEGARRRPALGWDLQAGERQGVFAASLPPGSIPGFMPYSEPSLSFGIPILPTENMRWTQSAGVG
jgi:hypothetical protein